MNKYYIHKCTGEKTILSSKEDRCYFLRKKDDNNIIKTWEDTFKEYWLPITKAEYDSTITLKEIQTARDKGNQPKLGDIYECIKEYGYPKTQVSWLYIVTAVLARDIELQDIDGGNTFQVDKSIFSHYFQNVSNMTFHEAFNKKYNKKTKDIEISKVPVESLEVGGTHYQKPIQVWDFVYANKIPFDEASVIKYICRHKEKNGAEDIKKAISYCKHILKTQYNENTTEI